MNKPYQVVRDFEESVAEYTGSKYAVAVDNCTNALFLCCKYLEVEEVTIPSRTYPSVPCSIIHAGGKVKFVDTDWIDSGYYYLDPYPITDSAHLFFERMFPVTGGAEYVCISFSATKPINIGKGGMILTDDEEAVRWFKQARYCGRHEVGLMDDSFDVLGWNMYMTPEQAARGLLLMLDRDKKEKTPVSMPSYPDLSEYAIYK